MDRLSALINRSLAVCLVFGCVSGLMVVGNLATNLAEVWPGGVASGQLAALLLNTAILLAFLVVTISAGLAGYRLLRFRDRGQVLAAVVLAAQSVAISVPGFQYNFTYLGLTGLAFGGSGGRFRIGLFYESGTRMNLSLDTTVGWLVVANVPAMAFLTVLIYRQWRMGGARRASNEDVRDTAGTSSRRRSLGRRD